MHEKMHTQLDDLSISLEGFKEAYKKRLEDLEVKFDGAHQVTKLKQRPQLKETLDMSKRERNMDNSEIKNAFSTYLKKGDSSLLDRLEVKSLSGQEDSNGGYFVPEHIGGHITQRLVDNSAMRQVASITSVSTRALDLLIDSKQATTGWADEVSDRPETDTPELMKVSIPVHEMYARPRATQQLVDDAMINIEEWLVSRVALKMAAMENQAFINGDGQGKPKGFLSYESVNAADHAWGTLEEVTTGANGSFGELGADTLYDAVNALKQEYHAGAVWMMSRSAHAAIQTLKDASGHYLWQPAMNEGVQPTLLGYPVVICDDMPELINGEASRSIAFGNFKAGYQIVDRKATEVMRDPYSAKPFIEYYTTRRVGGDVVDFEAIKVINFTAE